MMLIFWSAALLWFGHPHTTCATALPLSPRDAIVITVDKRPGLADGFVDAFVQEAAAIWQPLGVSVTAAPRETGSLSGRVTVVVDDGEVSASAVEPVGWIHFRGEGNPEPVIFISRTTAIRLLDGMASSRELPVRRHDALVARILGRALAHELGHYLLASQRHSTHGLMRATWSIDALDSEARSGFGISMDDVAELQTAGGTAAPVCQEIRSSSC